MRIAPLLLLALAGCASYSGPPLTPGLSTTAEVTAAMGEPALRVAGPGGETLLWYPRFPYGRQSFAARIAAHGRLIGIENRLTDEHIARLRVNETRKDDVLSIVGPPYRVSHFARMDREIWDYPTQCRISCFLLLVQFSPDGVVREVYQVLDPETLSRGPSR
jgi:hypothetical protein